MRTDKFSRPPRPIRVRDAGERPPKKSSAKTAKDSKSRFVGPYHFQDHERAEIIALLAQHNIGDDEGRALFASALEYEIATFRQTPENKPDSIPTTSVRRLKRKTDLDNVQRIAQDLLQALERAKPTQRERLMQNLGATDRFGREHDERYLDRLIVELDHLIQACAHKAPDAQPRPSAAEQRAAVFMKQFVRIYQECLDVGISTNQLAPIKGILNIIHQSTGIDIPDKDETLNALLTASP
jgi:hypothetical protein